jgi:2'-5' RNA ligase
VKDHWWWRPGWAPGRRQYAWHLTFADVPEVRAAAAQFHAALHPLGMLDVVPDRWLHLTVQGVGFADEVTGEQVERIAEAARAHIADSGPITISLPGIEVGTEGVWFPVDPWLGLQNLRLGARASVMDTLGSADGDEGTFWPHVAVAYCHSATPSAPVRRAVESVAFEPTTARVEHIDLIRLGRDERLYRWSTIARITL